MPPRLTLQGLEKKRHAPQTHHRQGSFFLSQLPCGHKPTQGLLITTNTTWSLGLAGGTHRLLTCPGGDIRSHQNPDPGGVGWGMGEVHIWLTGRSQFKVPPCPASHSQSGALPVTIWG